MFTVALVVVFFLFVGHLACELLAIFFRYNYAALSKHMAGAAMANYFAIAARGFVGLYAILVAYLIEKKILGFVAYTLCISASLTSVAIFSSILSNKMLVNLSSKKIAIAEHKRFEKQEYLNRGLPRINIFLIFFLGIQFVATSLAYALCMIFVENRLLIISIAPTISMLGTAAAAIFIEPKFAVHVDKDPKYGVDVSSKYLEARSISLFLSALIFFLLTFVDLQAG